MSIGPSLVVTPSTAAFEVEVGNQKFEFSTEAPTLELVGAGAKGAPGDNLDAAQVTWQLFDRAGIASRDDDLFPTLITKLDYEGITSATRVINRNVDNNLIKDSVVDTYDYNGQHYVWTTPYLGGTDLLANRPGTPSVVIT